jgi:hypothetical protein
MNALKRCLCIACCSACCLPAVALSAMPLSALYALPDPTRPPAGMVPVPPGAAGANSADQAASAAATASAPAAAKAPLNQLTLVRVDAKTGQGLAMIGGRMVRVGDTVGGAMVTAVDATGVTLSTTRGLRRMSLWHSTNKASETPTAADQGSAKEKP